MPFSGVSKESLKIPPLSLLSKVWNVAYDVSPIETMQFIYSAIRSSEFSIRMPVLSQYCHNGSNSRLSRNVDRYRPNLQPNKDNGKWMLLQWSIMIWKFNMRDIVMLYDIITYITGASTCSAT